MNAAVNSELEGLAKNLENVLINGDLSRLSSVDKIVYYNKVCTSIGVNPLTKPFEYINLNGKLTLYARKDCTEQLRKIHGISITIVSRGPVEVNSSYAYEVVARATDKNGKVDESIGSVNITGLKGEAISNAIMKAETKAKRRVTLSICGLGMLDETEVSSIPGVVLASNDQQCFDNRNDSLIELKKHVQALVNTLQVPKADVDRVLSWANAKSINDLSEEHLVKFVNRLEDQAVKLKKLEVK